MDNGFQNGNTRRFYKRFHPADLIIAAALGLSVLAATTLIDITLHDKFVLPTYSCDNPANAESDYCIQYHDNPKITIPLTSFTYELSDTRNSYWIGLNAMIFAMSIPAAVIRAILGSPKAAFLWAMTAIIPVLSGWEDAAYFYLQEKPIPDQLPWLEGNVWIGTVNSVINPGGIVTSDILYISMALAVVVLSVFWFVALWSSRRK